MRLLFSAELNTFTFIFAFMSSTYTWVIDFGHLFFPKKYTSTYMWIDLYASIYGTFPHEEVARVDVARVGEYSGQRIVIFKL